MANLKLKLVVDKEKNRVVFAESDKDFIDILLSFLTLPMGTIIRLLDKNLGVGRMDRLYKSVENLDAKYLQTDACKKILLQPRSEAEKQCEDLAININDLKPRQLYGCPSWDCFVKTKCVFTSVLGARCPCGQAMDKGFEWKKIKVDKDVFVKGVMTRFIISDDLYVKPTSIEATLSLLQSLQIKNTDVLEEMTVDVSKDEILRLLNRLLLSKTPLTDLFLSRSDTIIYHDSEKEKIELICAPRVKLENETAKGTKRKRVKLENETAKGSKRMRVRLLENKTTNKVVYAEAGEEFMDNVFSFLTFPLGSVVKLLNNNTSLGCVDKLYQSAEVLGLADADYIKSEECKGMLLSPKLASHFGCTNQVLSIETKLAIRCVIQGCQSCFEECKCKCSHGIKKVTLEEINPKLAVPGTEHGGGFTKEFIKFMMTNEMLVTPVSSSTVINTLKELKVALTNLTEREIICGETEVLNLLKACLLSHTPLDVAFSHNK